MKFYDREKELETLRLNYERAETSASFTMVTGRRRVGKTSLLLESAKDHKCLYWFVSRKNERLLCESFQKSAETALNLRIFGTVASFSELFEQLLKFSETERFTLIIDEFQEFDRVNPSIFSEIQDLWDRRHPQSHIDLIACGSVYSMMRKLFEDHKEPLFGRLNSKILLRSFASGVLKEILGDHFPAYEPEDLLCFYTLTGGVPKYANLLTDAGALTREAMLDFVTRPDSPFLDEGKDLLISEFGRDYGTYFSILQLIASGKTSQQEVDSIIGKNTGTYLGNLENDYALIVRRRPIFAKPESRGVRWMIHDRYLRFWFRFIYPNQALIEMGRHDLLREIIERGYEQFSGLCLEEYFRDKLAENGRWTEIGAYWDRKGENEIDIVAVNDLDKTALAVEVKRNPRRISLSALRVKLRALDRQLTGYAVDVQGLSLEDM
jgi:AAA+ ATPase superfamily predicted ATPase